MQLYVLALEMGVRSTELVARARDLGMHDIGVDTWLRPDQVAALRAGWAPQSLLPPPPGAPGGPWSGQAPSGPPPGTPPAGPPLRGPWYGGDQPPVPPSPGTAGWAPAPPPPRPGGPSGAGGDRKAVALVAVLVLVLMAGFVLFVGSRSDNDRRERRERAEAAEARIGRERTDEAEGRAAHPEDVAGSDVDGGPLVSEGWARDEYCRAAGSLMRFESLTGQSGIDGDFVGFVTQVVDGRDQWMTDVDAMIATEPSVAEDLKHYRDLYETYLWSISHDTTMMELEQLTNEIMKGDLVVVAGRINRFTAAECG